MDPYNQNNDAQQPMPPRPAQDWQQQAIAGAHGVTPQPSIQPQQWAEPATPPVNAQPSAAPGPSTPIPQPMMPDYGQAPQPSMPMMGNRPPRRKWPLVVVLVVLALAGAGVAAYLLFFSKDNTQHSISNANKKSTQSASSQSKELTSFNTVTFAAPAGLTDGYTKSEASSTDKFWTYTTNDQACAFAYGTVTASDLAGVDADEVVSNQIKALRDDGATVEGPTAIDALILKDTNKPATTYKLPTIAFTVSKDKTSVVTHYSVIVLKNGDRVVVNRVCATTDGTAVSDASLAAQEAKAKLLTVTAE